MATVTDVEVANQSFPNVRQDLNDILEALATNFSADAEPTTTYPNQFWYETDTNLLYIRNEANDAWVTLASINQTSGEWEPRTAVIQAVDSAGLALKTDEGTTRFSISDAGVVSFENYAFPSADGSNGQVLTTNGSGTLTFEDSGAGDKIEEGNSSVEVVDTGTGYVAVTVDGTETARFDDDGLTVNGGTDGTPLLLLQSNNDSGTKRNTLQFKNTDGVILDGDTVGSIEFFSSDVTNAGVGAFIDAQATSSSPAINLLFGTRQGGTLAEHMRLNSSGSLLVGKTVSSLTTAGFQAYGPTGQTDVTVSASECMNITRLTDDGNLIRFFQDSGFEGSISVSGTTVSYNGGHLARWSRLADDSKDTSIVKGTVMTNLDAMVEWSHDAVEAQDAVYDEEGSLITEAVEAKEAYTEDNEQLNKMAVSSIEGDPNVAGVFVNWDDDDDDFNDMNIAMTGDMVIRIAQGTTVARGDLLMSAGDGTAKPQGDDIVRSKTIAKVTSTHVSHTYDDGSYLVPCVLMAC